MHGSQLPQRNRVAVFEITEQGGRQGMHFVWKGTEYAAGTVPLTNMIMGFHRVVRHRAMQHSLTLRKMPRFFQAR